MTRQPLWVNLCRLPEKGKKEIEEIIEEMKERYREERGTGMTVKKQKKPVLVYNLSAETDKCLSSENGFKLTVEFQWLEQLGPWKFVRDIGSSSHLGLIKAPGQEPNGNNLGKSFNLLHKNGTACVLIKIASMRQF